MGTGCYSVHCTFGVQMPRWIDLLDGLFHSLGSGGGGVEDEDGKIYFSAPQLSTGPFEDNQ
eukprot:COSAG05_NODE_793_length_7295_cov_2.666481_8_plen_61_part_00